MKRKNLIKAAGLLLAFSFLLTGCKKDAETTGANAGTGKDILLYSEDPSYGNVTLCDLASLEATQKEYEITDEMISEEMESLLTDFTEYEEVDRDLQEGDVASFLLTAKTETETVLDFSDPEEGGYEMVWGESDFGPEFDQEVASMKKGESKTFSVTYDENFDLEEFYNQTVQFDVTLQSITVENVPEMTDEFVKNNLECDSVDALKTRLKDELADEYNSSSLNETYSELMSQIVSNSTFEGYSDDIVNRCTAEIESEYAGYMEMFGLTTVQEVYDMFEISQDDLKEEATNLAKQMLATNAIAKQQNMTITQEEYDQIIEGYVVDFDFESKDELMAQLTEDDIIEWIREDKVSDYLLSTATITKVPASMDEEYGNDDLDAEDFGDGEIEEIDFDDEEDDAFLDDDEFDDDDEIIEDDDADDDEIEADDESDEEDDEIIIEDDEEELDSETEEE